MLFRNNNTDLRISDFEVFILVTKERSFLKVAENLSTTSANINRIFKKFEKYFGVKLYSIKGGGVLLNEHGQKVLESSIKILEIINSLKTKDDNNLKIQLKKEITIVSTQGIVKVWAKNLFPELIEKFPQYNFVVHSHTSENEFDFDRTDIAVWTKLEYETLFKKQLLFDFKFGLFASDAYVKQFGLPKTKEDLKNHTIILLSPFNCSPFAQRSNDLFEKIGVNAGQVYTVSNTQILYEMIDQGKGIGPLSFSYPDIEKYHNVLPDNITNQESYIYYKKGVDNHLVEYIREKLRCLA